MNNTALIISLNFRAAHISHLVASYKQMEELGYETICYVHSDAIQFLPPNIRYITNLKTIGNVAISIFWFPSLKNIASMIKLKCLRHSKILYVFHEPLEKYSSYIASGNSRWWTIKFFLKYYVGLSFLFLSDRIILPSKKAINLYKNGLSKYINTKYDYLPLMYPDEYTEHHNLIKREYISYIGGISHDHAFTEYINYIYSLYKSQPNSNYKFLIASWRNVDINDKINKLLCEKN